ncbi:MAG: oligoribonuclease [Mariprofundales bacterium]
MLNISAKHLIWMDMEMTGLNPDNHHIIEIATLVTDENLDIIAEGPNLIIHQPEDVLQDMSAWCQDYHYRSGLINQVRASSTTVAEAEKETLDFIRKYSPKKASPLCGNTICQDRRFLARFMSEINDWLHYRMIDVSTLKELRSRWYPDIPGLEKKKTHLAKDDIMESILELRYYREHLMK